jgi:hypothetical protein
MYYLLKISPIESTMSLSAPRSLPLPLPSALEVVVVVDDGESGSLLLEGDNDDDDDDDDDDEEEEEERPTLSSGVWIRESNERR